MSSQVPDVEIPVERDPDALGEEHEIEDTPGAQPEEYSPELDLTDPVREASRADVADQIAEVPVDDEGADDTTATE
ncbi:MAG: hypothetical protein ACYC1Z_06660 [Georgenia sp.]